MKRRESSLGNATLRGGARVVRGRKRSAARRGTRLRRLLVTAMTCSHRTRSCVLHRLNLSAFPGNKKSGGTETTSQPKRSDASQTNNGKEPLHLVMNRLRSTTMNRRISSAAVALALMITVSGAHAFGNLCCKSSTGGGAGCNLGCGCDFRAMT